MHEIVADQGTLSVAPKLMTSTLLSVKNGVAISIGFSSPIDNTSARAEKNSGVASANGFPASGPTAIRLMLFKAQ